MGVTRSYPPLMLLDRDNSFTVVWTTPLEKVQSGPWPKKGKTILQSPTAEIMGPEAGAHGYIKGVCGTVLA